MRWWKQLAACALLASLGATRAAAQGNAAPARPAPTRCVPVAIDDPCAPENDTGPPFTADTDVCYRQCSTFSRRNPASRKDREEAQRWLLFYPLCETYLNQKISDSEEQIHKAASAPPPPTPLPAGAATDGRKATANLDQYKKALAKAQIDRHQAYNIIHDELHEELDYATWRDQIVLGATFLGGAGDARDLGFDLRWDTRTTIPAGFRSSLSLGLHWNRNLSLQTSPTALTLNDSPAARDPTARLAVPFVGTLSWSWILSSIFVAGGTSWTPSNNGWAIVGQIGVGFLQSWLSNYPGKGAGTVTEARFIVQPWIPIDHSDPVSVLFGIELGIGAGIGHSWCDPDAPREQDCHRLNMR